MKKLFTFLTLIIGLNTYSQTPAFPCAYGAGAYLTGGRGQTVYHVTTTAFNNNPGSFKWALEQAVANEGGTIVFDVSGVIELQPNYTNSQGGSPAWNLKEAGLNAARTYRKPFNISVLGQTAPYPGITIDTKDASLRFEDLHNIIFRYIKFRCSTNERGFWGNQYTDNLIVDHCSFVWGNSGTTVTTFGSYTNWLSGYTPGDISVQNCLFAHGGRSSNTGNTTSDPNGIFGDVSFIRNVFHEMSYRTPLKTGGSGQRDIINNIVSKTRNGKRIMRFDAQPVKINHIGNTYTASVVNQMETGGAGINDGHKIWTDNLGVALELYNNNNTYNFNLVPDNGTTGNYEKDAWDAFRPSSAPNNPDIPSQWFVNTQHPLAGRPYSIYNNSQLKNYILPTVGATSYMSDAGFPVFYRDSLDHRYVNDVQNDIDRNIENIVANRPAGVGLDYTSNTRPANFYQSNPHIPEAWLVANGITGTPTIHNQVQPSGYTLLEVYANQVDTCGNGPVANSCSGKNAPVATIGSPLAGNYVKNDTLNFSVNYTSDTAVTSVTYYLNGSVFMSTTNPFTFDTTALPEGSHNIYAILTDACGNTSNTDTVNITITGLTVQACNTTTPPTIDGIEETIWDNVTRHELAVTENGLPYPDTNTLKANYKVMWDATSLYVFVKVKDNILVMDSPQLDFFRDDALSIFIDALDNNSSTYDANDYYIGMKQGSSDIIVNNVLYTGGGITKTDVVTTEGYNMEVKIDWAYLGLTPNTTNPIGLDFRVDDDDNGGSREHHLLWNDETSTLWSDPSKFGVLILTNTSCNNTTGIKINNENNLVIYPNPTNGEVTIKSNEKLNKIEVYNALGSLVYNQDNINTKTESLNLNKLPKGVYSIKVYKKNKIVEQQLIKQ